jgi:MoaA/NifB/PqqE/SkfB family radical SAM enzyme
MGREELFAHLAEAKELGLMSVKLIGPGEPLEEPDLLNFIKRLKNMGLTVLIFTKGHVIGNDALCRQIHGMDGGALAAELRKLDVSILLGTTSFVPELEDAAVGRFGYHAERNEAILRLIGAGFADFNPGEATRLAFVCTPVTPKNIDEVFDLYVWARERNIQPVIAPTMIAGRALGKLSKIVPKREPLLQLYTRILVWAVERGVMTLEELKKYGVPAYAGGAWCNQVAFGMYMVGTGEVWQCPGRRNVLGNLKEESLTEIWNKSENRHYASDPITAVNNGCPAKEGRSFPVGFFEDVLERVLGFFANPH